MDSDKDSEQKTDYKKMLMLAWILRSCKDSSRAPAVGGQTMDAMESERKTPAVGGEAKKTLIPKKALAALKDRKNSSAPAVGGATASPDDVEEVDDS